MGEPRGQQSGTPETNSAVAATPASDVNVGAAREDDLRLVEALRRGDEAAFMRLVDCYHGAMLRLAQVYVPERAVAEEVVQETWLAVLQSLARFEGRAALKTWIFRIVVNMAKTRAQREGRSVPFSSLPEMEREADEPLVDVGWFRPADAQERLGMWVSLPQSWEHLPEAQLLSRETREHIREAITALPPHQRGVITLRDVEGWSSEETCAFLGISEANQRVLLHRARTRVRRALEHYLNEKEA
jgi:RNA polymerase sigma-70 factor, ECF subfamily